MSSAATQAKLKHRGRMQSGKPPVQRPALLRLLARLACSDPGIEIIADNRAALAAKYRLDDSNPWAQRCMLNKLCTYEQAVAAGVPTPRFWRAASLEDIERVRDQLSYPLIVKPL